MREQKERRSSVEHWMNEGFQQIDQTYRSLLNKATGQESAAQVNHCYVCHKSGRGKNIMSCSKCEKSVCGEHATALVLCSKCNVQENQTVQEVPLATATFTPMRTRTTPSSKTNARCYKCPKNSRFHCSVCQKPACKDHRSIQNPKHCGDCH
uniref:Uncharacterized protein n=1 Tax=Ditylenchus dipsaci TaxID=166011 RepID=A0A915CX71_9BILA